MEHYFIVILGNAWPSQPGTFHFLIVKVGYFISRSLYILDFFVINFSYLVIIFLINRSIVKSNDEVGKVNEEKKIENLVMK